MLLFLLYSKSQLLDNAQYPNHFEILKCRVWIFSMSSCLKLPPFTCGKEVSQLYAIYFVGVFFFFFHLSDHPRFWYWHNKLGWRRKDLKIFPSVSSPRLCSALILFHFSAPAQAFSIFIHQISISQIIN